MVADQLFFMSSKMRLSPVKSGPGMLHYFSLSRSILDSRRIIEKLQDISTHLSELQEDLANRKLSDEGLIPSSKHPSQSLSSYPERKDRLAALKVYGRDPANADPIFTPEVWSSTLRHKLS